MGLFKILAIVIFLFLNLIFNVFQEKEMSKPTVSNSLGIVDLPEDLLYTSTDTYTQNIFFGNLFEGLVNKTSSGDITSGIAERFTVSEDGLEYRFYIRNDAYFSNGEKITSYDFIEFFENIIKQDKDRFYYKELKAIKGVSKFYDGDVSFNDVGININGQNTLIFKLENKDDKFLSNLSKDKFSLRKNFKYLQNYRDFYEYIPYSGPYIINNIENPYDGNVKIILKPNDYYYLNNYKTVKEKVYSYIDEQKIVLEVFDTRELALSAYKLGRIDFIVDVPYSSIRDYFGTDQLYYIHNDLSVLSFNLDTFREKEDTEVSEKVVDVSNDIVLDEEITDEDKDVKAIELIEKGNFINFIIDPRDIGYMSGIDGEYLKRYEFDNEYIFNQFSNYDLEGIKRLKIVTESDDNYIELSRSFKDFLKSNFNIDSNIVALDSDYIENSLKSSEYDILISSNYGDSSINLNFEFDKPSMILSKIDLLDNEIDGNGTIIIDNIY